MTISMFNQFSFKYTKLLTSLEQANMLTQCLNFDLKEPEDYLKFFHQLFYSIAVCY